MEEFLSKCKKAADFLSKWERITVIGHRDADGICASVIIRDGFSEKDVDIRIIRHATDLVALSNYCKGSLPVFVDYGSTELENIEDAFRKFLILDHHPMSKPHQNMVNPWEFGIDGTRELSGAGVSYFVAKAHDSDNTRLSNVAIVGAMGDKMHLSGFLGPNRTILEDARRAGLLKEADRNDGLMIGGLPFTDNKVSALEVANIIDSCASVNRPEVAVGMLSGDMSAREKALGIYNDYKDSFNRQLEAITSNWEMISKGSSQHLAYFIYLPAIEPGFTGVLAEELVLSFQDKPVVVISKAPYGLKASARSTNEQIKRHGIDLGRAMSLASEGCGGKGGGHDVAAGASFGEEELETFKSLMTLELFSQWKKRLKLRFELEAGDPKQAYSLASSLAVDNEKHGTTTSLALNNGNKLYIMVTSEDIGTFKNTVDDLVVCLASCKDIVGMKTDH